MAEHLALPISDNGVAGSNPAGREILPEPKWHFIAQSISFLPSHCLGMTELLLKGRKKLIQPSIPACIEMKALQSHSAQMSIFSLWT